MAAAAGLAVIPAIKAGAEAGIEAGIKVEREAERVEEKLHRRSSELFKRELPVYDFEKVAFQSLYGTGLLAVGWLGLKLGQFMIWTVRTINNMDIFNMIPDEAVNKMNVADAILGRIDAEVMIPYAPLMPAAITGGAAFIEYLRVREGLPPKQRKVADAACGMIGLGVLSLALTPPVAVEPVPYEGGEPGECTAWTSCQKKYGDPPEGMNWLCDAGQCKLIPLE